MKDGSKARVGNMQNNDWMIKHRLKAKSLYINYYYMYKLLICIYLSLYYFSLFRAAFTPIVR